jgi:hypothetical protein
MGVTHGAWCIGCCWGLMVVLFALGVMSVTWMLAIAALIFAEKVLPFGARLPRAIGVGLIGLGLWIALAPGGVPGLTEPGSGHQMTMEPADGEMMGPAGGEMMERADGDMMEPHGGR